MSQQDQPWSRAIYTAGTFQPPAGGGVLPVRDKSTGEVFAEAGRADASDVDAAVTRAVPAQRDWAALGYAERAAVLRRVAAALERDGAMRELIVRETGSIPGKADYEIGAAISELTEAAALASRPSGEVLQTGHAGRTSISERLPVGLVGVITPWNFPLVLGMRVIAPALALGNVVLLKPSPETPLSGGLAIARLFVEAGAPAGIFQVLPGGEDVGRRLVEHPDIQMVHFTGSTAVGRQIAQTAGGLLKKVSLELGGNNALVVLDDADIEQATMIGAWSSFHYQGQTCISAGRHIVDRAVVDEYTAGIVARAAAITLGDPATEPVGLGPVINDAQLARGKRLLDDAVAGGARVLTGGTVEGPFFRPTVVVDVDPASALWTEEIFAPIVAIVAVDGTEEAVALANDTRYGLVSSVLGADVHRATTVARRLNSAMVHVNDATPQDEALAPFGGVGQSGLGGRSGGDANLEEFTERRWLTVSSVPAHYPY
ncbi:aldehyde dehydrogenase family protein [Rugosimonospora africana]|uniref:Benzaldehyde dehydrogenase n=1 Tax=Rugosimonospora africana TaxID=556532 RepID=A0A8J3VRA6_9ACTN|nr:aldehyde dehydrogenase family protein [Rugosimonospora africana]GIH15924.1 benzaldehyde dehydrogenase [Rugosimonospora africana]